MASKPANKQTKASSKPTSEKPVKSPVKSEKQKPAEKPAAASKTKQEEDVSNQTLSNRLTDLENKFATHQHGKDGSVTIHQSPVEIVDGGKGDSKDGESPGS